MAPSLRKLTREFVQGLRVSLFEQGNFTIVTLQDGMGKIAGAGASKRMPGDSTDEAIGYNLALIRAVEVAVDDFVVQVETRVLARQNSNGSPKQATRA